MTRRDYSSEPDYYNQHFEKDGVVSVWVGLRGDEGDLDADVLQDLCGVGYYELSDQETNHFDFELVDLSKLLEELSYSGTFTQAALAAAKSKGIERARWVTVQYNFDYDPAKVKRKIADDPIFIGSFPYSAES